MRTLTRTPRGQTSLPKPGLPLLRKLQTPILTPQHPSTSSTATPPPMSLGVVVGGDEGATVEPGDVVEGMGVGVRVAMLMCGWTGGCWVERVYGLNLKVYGHVFTFPLTSEYMSMRDGQGPSRALKQTYNPIPWLCWICRLRSPPAMVDTHGWRLEAWLGRGGRVGIPTLFEHAVAGCNRSWSIEPPGMELKKRCKLFSICSRFQRKHASAELEVDELPAPAIVLLAVRFVVARLHFDFISSCASLDHLQKVDQFQPPIAVPHQLPSHSNVDDAHTTRWCLWR